jgi:hypothetical protein
MDAKKLVDGYRSVLTRIYACDAYYERVLLYLSRIGPQHSLSDSGQKWITMSNARAFVTSLVRQGVFGPQRWSYWKFLLVVATRYRHCIGVAMTLLVMGYHFQVITGKLFSPDDAPDVLPAMDKAAPAEAGGQVR